jgi:hypothetical protein
MLDHEESPVRQRRARHKAERPQSFYAMMKCVLLALPFTVLLGAFVLCGCAALLLLTPNPIHYARLAGTLCLYLTAALGGMLATRLYGRRAPVLCGLTLGILLLLLLGIPTLFMLHDRTGAAATLLMRLLIPFASLSGALLAARKRKTRRHKAHKR